MKIAREETRLGLLTMLKFRAGRASVRESTPIITIRWPLIFIHRESLMR